MDVGVERSKCILYRWATRRVTRSIPRCSMASSRVLAGIPDEMEEVHETHRSPSRVETSTLVGDNPRDQRRCGGITPSSVQQSVGEIGRAHV